MRILLDGRLLSKQQTGISRYSEEIIKIYQKKFGYESVSVIVNEDYETDAFKIIKTKLKPYKILDFIFIYFFLKKIEFDLMHSLFYSNSFIKIKNKIYITTVHDLMYRTVGTFFGNNFFKKIIGIKYFDFIIGKSLNNSDYIITVSKTTQDDLKRIFSKESTVIVEGINKIEVDDEVVEEVKGEKFFLYIGNSRPHKNLDFLIESYIESNSQEKLVLVGTKNSVKSKNSKILCLGYLNDKKISWLYKNTEAFIFPSLYEGFGLPVLEALYKGSKVFSSTGGALKEFPKSAVSYFNPNKKEELINLIKNYSEQEKNLSDIKEVLEKYDWKTTKNEMDDFFKKNLKV